MNPNCTISHSKKWGIWKNSESILIVEDSISIYTYLFEPKNENKANIFFIHGAGGNVSTYISYIEPLLENGFAVYELDWRGFGRSTGTPEYKGVMKDTEVAFDDFIVK